MSRARSTRSRTGGRPPRGSTSPRPARAPPGPPGRPRAVGVARPPRAWYGDRSRVAPGHRLRLARPLARARRPRPPGPAPPQPRSAGRPRPPRPPPPQPSPGAGGPARLEADVGGTEAAPTAHFSLASGALRAAGTSASGVELRGDVAGGRAPARAPG